MSEISEPSHPLIFGTFQTYGALLKAARGKANSNYFETTAKKWEKFAQKSAEKLETKRCIRDVCEEIFADETQPPELRDEAARRAKLLDSELKFYLPLHENFEKRAADFRQMAKRAREFEAFFFPVNPYIDPLIDKMEDYERKKAARRIARGPKTRKKAK
jgi:hypothetical protein